MERAPQQDDHSRREALILGHYPMVRQVAYRMARRFPRCVDVDDLINIGMIGLIDAVDRFEDTRSGSFGAYARIRVQGAIVDEMRKNDWVPRSVRDRAAMLKRGREALADELGRPPTQRELAEHLGVDLARLKALLETADIRVLVSTEEREDDNATLGDSLGTDSAERDLERMFLASKVRESVGQLRERDQQIVEMYYYHGRTFKDISEVLGVTESRVSQLHSAIKRRIREQLRVLVED